MMKSNDFNPKEYGYDMDAITDRAREILSHNRPYCRIYEQMERLDPLRDFVKRAHLMQQARRMEEQEIHRLVILEENRRKDSHAIGDYLAEHAPDDARRYATLMTAFGFLIDMVDNTVHDINDILYRCKTAVKLENFPELEQCRRLTNEMGGQEICQMPEWKQDLWSNEADSLFQHLINRVETYQRKADREAKRLMRKPE